MSTSSSSRARGSSRSASLKHNVQNRSLSRSRRTIPGNILFDLGDSILLVSVVITAGKTGIVGTMTFASAPRFVISALGND